MAELLTVEYLAALATLTVMEIVLGIDNIVFISVLAEKLPEEQQPRARRVGLLLAMVMRIGLLLGITWIMRLKTPLFHLPLPDPVTDGNLGISGRDLILILGGGFLIYKATHEIHDKLEGSKETLRQPKAIASFKSVVTQIIMLDLVFSLDSVITAVGMVKGKEGHTWQPIAVMITAVVLSIIVMLIFAGPIANFIKKHPTTKMLALSFLLMIGAVLVADGFHQHIGKGYIYAAMIFSVFVEALNLRAAKVREKAKGG
ncbi:MAG: TerC family protein [Phycisphaeraceae bacterium]